MLSVLVSAGYGQTFIPLDLVGAHRGLGVTVKITGEGFQRAPGRLVWNLFSRVFRQFSRITISVIEGRKGLVRRRRLSMPDRLRIIGTFFPAFCAGAANFFLLH